jgi:predicted acyltransferase
MTRFLLSILAGLLLNVILGTAADHLMHTTGLYPPYGEPMRDHSLLLLAFGYRAGFMVLGGYLTAYLARRQAKKAALTLGIIGSVLWLAGAIAMWDHAYPWYNIIGVIAGVPITMLGYGWYRRRSNSQKVHIQPY